MTKAEVSQVLTLLKAAFPHAFKDSTERDSIAVLNLWHMMLAEKDAQVVSLAVKHMIATRTQGFSPTIGELLECVYQLDHHNELDPSVAWSLVSKACSNGLYGYREEFEKLPEQVQRVVGSPEQLHQWAMMDSETVESVVASNFMKGYRTIQQRDRELEKLPADVKSYICELADKMGDMKGLEAPRETKLLPMHLEKLEKKAPRLVAPKPEVKPEYKPPDPDEWEKKRAKAMRGFIT